MTTDEAEGESERSSASPEQAAATIAGSDITPAEIHLVALASIAAWSPSFPGFGRGYTAREKEPKSHRRFPVPGKKGR